MAAWPQGSPALCRESTDWARPGSSADMVQQPIGAFFGQIGQLHEVHHIWQYPDLETRKKTREQTWTVSTWADTVQEVGDGYQGDLTLTISRPSS